MCVDVNPKGADTVMDIGIVIAETTPPPPTPAPPAKESGRPRDEDTLLEESTPILPTAAATEEAATPNGVEEAGKRMGAFGALGTNEPEVKNEVSPI